MKPDEGYSTAEMYRRLDEPGSVLVRNSRYMQDAVAANNVHAVAVELHNSFERVVPKDSSLRTIKDALRAQGALGTLLSGSGSAVFGLFDDQSAGCCGSGGAEKNMAVGICGSTGIKTRSTVQNVGKSTKDGDFLCIHI